MLKQAYQQGTIDALRMFGLEKFAAGIRPKGLNVVPSQAAPIAPTGVRGAVAGQAQHLSNLGKGIANWVGGGPGAATGKSMTWASAKGLLPSAGIAAAGLYGANKLLSDSPEEKQRKQMAAMGVPSL